jgi:hypothetical protein
MTDEPGKIALLDASIEKQALFEMACDRERLWRELETASLRVRVLQAQVHACRICFRERSEGCGDPDMAARLMSHVERWGAGSMPTCTASPTDIQEARGHWLRTFTELLR